MADPALRLAGLLEAEAMEGTSSYGSARGANSRNKRLGRLGALVTAVAVTFGMASAFAFNSGGNPGTTGSNTITWTGQGASNGTLGTTLCDAADDPNGANQPYLLWILTVDGGSITSDSTTPTLHLGGTGSGDFQTDNLSDNSAAHFVTPYFTPDTNLTAYADMNVLTTGNGAWNLVISHGCPGGVVPPASDLKITKVAVGSYDAECDWGITKSVSPSGEIDLTPGHSATLSYAVTASAPACTRIENVQVSGTITVANPNGGAVTVDTLTDTLSNTTVCAISDFDASVPIPADGGTTYHYTCDLGTTLPTGDLTNTATVSYLQQDLSDGSTLAANSESFTTDPIVFTPTLTDNCATVSDTNAAGPQGVHVCVPDINGGSFTWNYQVTVPAPTLGTCVDINNKASFVDNSTPQLSGFKTTSVKVCNFNAPLTIGYWGNHLAKNGTTGCTGLPSGTGCSSNGPWTKQFLPQYLGTYPVSTFQLAAKVFAANNCSNASTSAQNAVACLAAQLLGAELNVANVSNPCIVTVTDGINDANNFLKGLTVDGVTGISYVGPPPASYSLSTAQRNEALTLKNKLVNYNQGGGC